MKKFIYSLIALAGLFTLASCRPDKLLGGKDVADGVVDATFSVTLSPGTKAIADGTTVDKLYAGIYEVSGTTYTWVADNADAPVAISSKTANVTFNGKIELGKSYKVVFWAQKQGAPYAIDWAKSAATGPAVTVTATGDANAEARDAFFGVYETGTVTGSIDLTGSPISLKRPFAQVNVLVPTANFADATAAVISSMTVAQAPTVLNLITKETSDPADWTFSTAAISEAAFGSYASTHRYVAMNYVLVDQATAGAQYDVTFSVTCGSQSVSDKALANIPLKPNGRTNIVGNVFDSNFDITVPILVDPGTGTEQELTTVTVTVGQNPGNAVALDAGYNADPTQRTAIPIGVAVSHPVQVEADKPQITVNPPTVADAEWIIDDTTLGTGHLNVTPKVANGAAAITLVFPSVTKTEYSSATVELYVRVGNGINPVKLATPVPSVTDHTESSITLTWDAVPHADTYGITKKVKTAQGDPTVVISDLTANTYTITGLDADTEYTFTVQALTTDTAYEASDIASIDATTDEAAPVAYGISKANMENGSVAVKIGENVVTEALADATVTLVASPDANYELSEITVSKAQGTVELSGTGNTRTFTMPAEAVTVSATFSAIKYAVNLETMTNGSVSSDKETAAAGETVTLTITPATNYELSTITVSGSQDPVALSGSENTRTFTMPAEAVTVSATFAEIPAGIPAGDYVVAVKSGNDYIPMSSIDDGASTKRFKAATSFSYTSGTINAVASNIWTLATISGGYSLEAKADPGNYLTIVANNNGAQLSSTAAVLTFDEQNNGSYHVTTPDGNSTRYLSKNSSGTFFAFYANTNQNVDIYLIPAQVAEQVATPTITGENDATEIPAQGSLNVTLACSTPGATIHYTTDGSVPTVQSSTYPSPSEPISLSEACTVKAIAVKDDMVASEIASQEFTKEGAAFSATYTVTSKTAVSSSGTVPQGSSASYSQTANNVSQMTSGNSITLTLTGYAGKTIVGASVSVKSNASSGTGSLSLKTGSTTIASIASNPFNNAAWNGAWSSSYVSKQLNVTSTTIAPDASIVLTISATANSLYFESLTIQYY